MGAPVSPTGGAPRGNAGKRATGLSGLLFGWISPVGGETKRTKLTNKAPTPPSEKKRICDQYINVIITI